MIKYKTADGGEVILKNGITGQFHLSVTQLDEDQEPFTAGVHLSNSQGFDLAMELLSRTEVKV